LLLRIVFGIYFITAVGFMLGLVLAINYAFGLAAMCGAAFLLFLLCVRLERRSGLYTGSSGLAELFGDGGPALPPPGTQALPPPGPPQIGQAKQRALPGPTSMSDGA
jgi:hypothetical protein